MPPKKNVQQSKCCPMCGRTLPLSNFYPHRLWVDQIYHDLWCKDCVSRECKDEESLQHYFYENNREWKDELYEVAVRTATKKLSTDQKYISSETPNADKRKMESKSIVKNVLMMMNLSTYYGYVENDGAFAQQKANIKKEDLKRELEDQKQMVYNNRWHGYFTPKQVECLEEIYAQYERDFDLSDVSLQDYAMKVSKASFHADHVYDLMRRGDATISDYKEAQKIFDDLSKSANFAACRRKPGETTGMGSLGEIILRIEGTGKLNVEGDHWDPDSVDLVLNDYRHALVAAGRDGVI